MKPKRALDIPPSQKKTNYPEPFAALMAGRIKRKLGDRFGLTNFGVNLTTLEPGAMSALCHEHAVQDEFVYVVEGIATVIYGDDVHRISAGDCIGFPKGTGLAHQIRNDSDATVTFLEIGDRTPNDSVSYPHDDLVADLNPQGAWQFKHKDGAPY